MRRSLFPAVAALALGCATAKPPPPPPPPAAEAAPANLEVAVSEVIDDPTTDGMAYARVFIGATEAGQTALGRRSQEKLWSGRVPPGNHPVRIEYWLLPGVADWVRLDDQWQAPERFVRVKEGTLTRVRLRFSDGGKRHELAITRSSPPAAALK